MNGKTGRFAIIEQLLADNIHYMFGNPGTVEQGFLDSLEEYPDFKYILTLQETIAVAVADGYARKTKRPAVVQLHSGVGLGNGIGMMYQAKRGHAPLVVIAGESGVRYDSMDAQMAADLVGMAKPVTKWATRVVDPSSTLRVLRRAIKMAATPPTGPVFVCLPMDILDRPVEEEVVPTSFLYTRVSPEAGKLQEVSDILAVAEHPMMIVGDGIAFSGAQEELTRVAELTGSEVWGADSSEVNMRASHPLFGGLLGHMFGEHSRPIVRKADAVLICGTYVFPEVFPALEGVFSPGARVVHIDLDSYEMSKNFPLDIGIVADPKLALGKLADILSARMTEGQKRAAAKRRETISSEKKAGLQKVLEQDAALKNVNPLHPSQFMEELSRQIPKDAVIFDEALTTSPELNRYIPADVPGNFFQTRGGSLGVGIPGAIGIKIAAPDKTVIGFTGDGGSLYTIQALWTAAHYNVGAKFVICNNHSYKLLKLNVMQYWKERGIPDHEFPKSFELENPAIRFDQLSESFGVPAERVERGEQIKPAIERMLAAEGPYLVDLVISKEVEGHQPGCKCGQ